MLHSVFLLWYLVQQPVVYQPLSLLFPLLLPCSVCGGKKTIAGQAKPVNINFSSIFSTVLSSLKFAKTLIINIFKLKIFTFNIFLKCLSKINGLHQGDHKESIHWMICFLELLKMFSYFYLTILFHHYDI